MPLVSIIVPNYNHAPFLKERIKSILCQSFQDFELILLDDSSSDGSQNILKSYKDNPKVSAIILNKENSGSTFAQWNKGIELCHGQIIWIAESDDVATPELLDKLLQPFLRDKSLVLSYCNSTKIDSNGNRIGRWSYRRNENKIRDFNDSFSYAGIQYLQQHLLFENTIPNASAVLFRKSAYINVGKADVSIEKCGDWFLWMKIVLEGNMAFCNESLNHFRQHNGSVIATALKGQKKGTFYNYYDLKMREAYNKYLLSVFPPHIPEIDKIRQLNETLYRREAKEDLIYFLKKGKIKNARKSWHLFHQGI